MNPIDKVNFKKPDVLVGLVIIILIIIGGYLYKRSNKPKTDTTFKPVSAEFKKEFEDNFKYDIPENRNSIELNGEGRGIATNKEILADVDNPQPGYFYEAWVKDDNNLISLGKLFEGKGGWMIDFPEISNTENKKVVVSLEKDFDNKLEKLILEGSFK